MNKSKITTIGNMKISVIVSYITLIVSVVGNIVSARFILKYIGSEYYGFYTFSVSLTSYISIISTALSSSYVKFAAAEQSKEANNIKKVNTIYAKLMLILGSSLLLIALIILGCLYFGGFSLPQYNESSRTIIFVCVILSIVNVFFTISLTVFSLYCNYKKSFLFLRIVSLLTTLITSISAIIISIISGHSSALLGPILLAISSLIIQLSSNIVIMIYSIKHNNMLFEKTSLKAEKILVKSIISFSSILLISAIVDSINTAADSTILGFLSNGDAVTRHHYAHSFSTYLIVASSAISMTFIPRIHELIAKDPAIVVERNAIREYFNSLIETEKNNLTIARENYRKASDKHYSLKTLKTEIIKIKTLYKKSKKNEDHEQTSHYFLLLKTKKEEYQNLKNECKKIKIDSGNQKQAHFLLMEAKRDLNLRRKKARKQTKQHISFLEEEINKKDNKKELDSLFLKICRTQMLVVFLIVGGFFATGKEFITLWLGADYLDVYYYALVYLGLSTVPLTINISIEIQRAVGKHKFRAVSYLIIAIINVCLSVLFVVLFPKQYAIWGCIIGTIFSSVVGIWIIMNLYNKNNIGLPIKQYFLHYLSTLIVCIASYLFASATSFLLTSAFHLPVIVIFLIKGIVFVSFYLLINLIFNLRFIDGLIPERFKKLKKIISLFEQLNTKFLSIKEKAKANLSNSFAYAKTNKKKTSIAALLSFVVPLALCGACSLSSLSKNANVDKFAFDLTNYIDRNNLDYKSSYLNVSLIDQNDDNVNRLNALYSNFHSSTLFKSQYVICEENIELFYENESITSSKITSLVNYSSYKTSKSEYRGAYRFNDYEIFTLYGPHDYKAKQDGYDGFIYITDSLADKIIANNRDTQTYDDIIYTGITLRYLKQDGTICERRDMITNIIDSEFSSYLKKTPSGEIYLISNDLFDNSGKDAFSLVAQFVFYNNTYSVASELKMIMNTFTYDEIRAVFYTFNYQNAIYEVRNDLSSSFYNLYYLQPNIFVGYCLPLIIVFVFAISLIMVFRKYYSSFVNLLFLQLFIFASVFLAYSLLNYVYYFTGFICIVFFMLFFLCYFFVRRFWK